MTKVEFIDVLRQKLSIIEEKELDDILEEYKQHIEMKISNDQVTEEKAIEDFGDINELVADILESYHVKADYDVNDTVDKKNNVKDKTIEVTSKTKDAVKGGFKKAYGGIKTFFGKCVDKVKTLFKKSDKKRENTDKKSNKFGDTCKCATSSVWNFLKKAVILIWNVFIIFLISIVSIFTIVFLYIAGTSLVLTIQKLPLIGVLIGSVGVSALMAAVILGLYLLIKKKETSAKRGKVKIIALSTLVAGAVLGGIGTGVAISEFTSFTYGGVKVVNAKQGMVYRDNIKLPMDAINEICIDTWLIPADEIDVAYDADVPYGEVYMEVVDNTEGKEYNLQAFEQYTDDTLESIYLDVFENTDVVRDLMGLKDELLKDIKKKEVYSYIGSDVTSLKFIMNPEMEKFVR